MAVSLIKPAPEAPPDEEQPPRQPLLAMPDLAPYVRGGSHTVRALGNGSAALARRIWRSPKLRALLGRVDWGAALRNPACWFCTAGAGLAAWRIIGPYAVPVAAGLAAGWGVLALMHSSPGPEAAEPVEEQQPEAPASQAPDDPRAAFLAHVRRGIGTASGVHLRTLATMAPTDGFTIAEIRALCDRYGVLVSDRVKVARKVSVGVRLADLPALSPTVVQERDRAGSSAA